MLPCETVALGLSSKQLLGTACSAPPLPVVFLHPLSLHRLLCWAVLNKTSHKVVIVLGLHELVRKGSDKPETQTISWAELEIDLGHVGMSKEICFLLKVMGVKNVPKQKLKNQGVMGSKKKPVILTNTASEMGYVTRTSTLGESVREKLNEWSPHFSKAMVTPTDRYHPQMALVTRSY